MNHSTNQISEFLGGESKNLLWQYVQSMPPETVAQLSKPGSSDVLQVMERNLVGLLGGLPSEHFNVTVTTSREQLGRLLASAMMSGYFLRNAEQRLQFDQAFQTTETITETGLGDLQ